MDRTAALQNDLQAAAIRSNGKNSQGPKSDDLFSAMLTTDADDRTIGRCEVITPKLSDKKLRPARDDKQPAHDTVDTPVKKPRTERKEAVSKADKPDRAEPVKSTKEKAEDKPVEDTATVVETADKNTAVDAAPLLPITSDWPELALAPELDAEGIQAAAITIEDLLADIAAAIPVTVIATLATATQPAGDAAQAVSADTVQPVATPELAAALPTPEAASSIAPVATAPAQPDKPTEQQILPKPEVSNLPAEIKQAIADKTQSPAEAVADNHAKKTAKKDEAQTFAAPVTARKGAAGETAVQQQSNNPVATQSDAAKPTVQAAATPVQTAVKAEPTVKAADKNAAPVGAPAAATLETAIKIAQPYEPNAKSSAVRVATQPALIEQVAVRLNHMAKNGDKSINIQLHPAELGRIEVKLDVTSGGTARATVTTDNSATLDLMQKDRSGLERALSDAGLKLDSGSLSFNLREGNQQQNAFDQTAQNNNGNRQVRAEKIAEELPAAVINIAVGPDLASGRVDIRA